LKLFVCSDVHGNYRALDAAMSIYRREFPCDFLFLGDAVGYGAHPDACLDVLLNLPRAGLVLGNHDAAMLEEMGTPDMNEVAMEAIEWTGRRLDERYRGAIRRRFRLSVERERWLGVHGSPFHPEEYAYLLSPLEAERAFFAGDFRLCFVGHTHSPAAFAFGRGEFPFAEGKPVALEAGERYIFNPGSVGQPRDRDPRAACAVYDDEAGTVTLLRCEYDIEAEARDIVAAGLPAVLADRLFIGA
jgi:diadenosine tetraphosphatase ApaH/serine/threonine PP2A family protein phosphatase